MNLELAKYSVLGVSFRNQETALNTPQAIDTSIGCALSNLPDLESRIETDKEEMTGTRFPTRTYHLGDTSKWSVDCGAGKAQPHHVLFLFGYAAGNILTEAAGAGFRHTITYIPGKIDSQRWLKTFTLAGRLGKTIAKERFGSMCVGSATLDFSKDSFLKATGECQGTGKFDTNKIEEVVAATDNVDTIALAANGVQGTTDDERRYNVDLVEAEIAPGVYEAIAHTGVSDAAPAVITITNQAGIGDPMNYRVTYTAIESEAWMTFPPRILEDPLKVARMDCVVGGVWDGTQFRGGMNMSSDLDSFSYSLNNNPEISFLPGAGDAIASEIFADPSETLKFDRKMKDYIIQMMKRQKREFGVRVVCEGDEFDVGHKYSVECIWPVCGITAATKGADKRLKESVELGPLDKGTYPTTIIRVKTLVDQVAA